MLVLAGSGAAAVSAREGALKLREAAHVLAEGYEGEYLLHGRAVALQRGDALLLVGPAADRDGLLRPWGRRPGPKGSRWRASRSRRSVIRSWPSCR